MKTYIATTKSLNLSIRAQKTLASFGIFSKIATLDPAITGTGCAYGVEFASSEAERVKNIFRRAGIPYGFLIDGGTGVRIK